MLMRLLLFSPQWYSSLGDPWTVARQAPLSLEAPTHPTDSSSLCAGGLPGEGVGREGPAGSTLQVTQQTGQGSPHPTPAPSAAQGSLWNRAVARAPTGPLEYGHSRALWGRLLGSQGETHIEQRKLSSWAGSGAHPHRGPAAT